MHLDPSVRTPTASVATVDHLATSAGVAMLRAGGTAVDAAVAASAVLAVTSPHLCGMGGDLFALVSDPSGVPRALNASGRAGSGADPARLRAEGQTTMPFRGHVASVPVPGCVDGWVTLHAFGGRLPLDEVLGPAIGYAADGFPASPLLCWASLLLIDTPGAEELAGPLRPGQLLRRPGCARALRAIARDGRHGFYGGEFGDGLLRLGAGEYLPADLEHPQADWVDPLGVEVWGHQVWTIPPNSQGYCTLLGAAVAAGLDLAELPDDPDRGAPQPSDATWAHLLIESARAAAHDRPQLLWEHADVAPLLRAEAVAARRDTVAPDRRTPRPGRSLDGGTMALCVVDGDGVGVTLIQSNASGFGAHLAVGGTGILVHNRGMGFSLTVGHPAEYGPGRRPPHTLAPLLVTSPAGDLRAVIGTMGGDQQPQVLLQLLARMLHGGQSPGEAVAAGRWVLRGTERGFDTWDDDLRQEVVLEREVGGWAPDLRARGHRVAVEPAGHLFGHANAIVVEPDHLAAAADPRAATGSAAGF